MKLNIHPKCHQITASCRCGNSVSVVSTLSEPITLDTCSSCHPTYTREQRKTKARKAELFRSKYNTDLF